MVAGGSHNTLFLLLSYTDDLWVVSRDLMFDPRNSFLASSAFYGPTSSNLIEISPIRLQMRSTLVCIQNIYIQKLLLAPFTKVYMSFNTTKYFPVAS